MTWSSEGRYLPVLNRVMIVIRRILWGFREIGFGRSLRGSFALIMVWVRRPNRVRCRTTDDLDIVFDYPAQMMPTLVLFGDLLEPEIRMLPQVLKPGAVAVDVGASIGTWAMSAARAGARVLACEPDPANIRVMRENLHRNGLADRIEIHQLGLGAQVGEGVLVRHRHRYMNRVTDVAASPEEGGESSGERFPVLTVDELVHREGLSHIDILKINTAGGERDVAEGCRQLLRRRQVGMILMLDGVDARSVLDDLADYGYEIGIWDGNRGELTVVRKESELADVPRGPMNRYLILRACEPVPGRCGLPVPEDRAS
jgi:FkbM family methyltransferase